MATTSMHTDFLQELGLLRDPSDNKSNKNREAKVSTSRPTALDVLEQLLSNKTVSEESVRNAYEVCCTSRSDQVKLDCKEVSDPSQQVVESAADAGSSVGSSKQNSNTTANVRTRHIALRFYYDGGNYTGLAENVGMSSDKSIEKALFAALSKAHLLLNHGHDARTASGYSRCGRTDKGVSAAGQVVGFHLRSAFRADATWDAEGQRPVETSDLPNNSHQSLTIWVPPKNGRPDAPRQRREIKEYAFDKIMNNLLPPDIRILGWTPVSMDFSARFSAVTRTYRYFFVKREMDLDKIRQGLVYMVGRHDFRNLCKMDVEKVYNFERVIHRASVVEDDRDCADNGVCYLEIHGQAFLWHQIRCIASILFLVGRGLEEPEVVLELFNIEKCPGKPGYPLADERPLVLHDCGYPNLHVGYSTQNLWKLVCLQEEQWEDFVLSAARLRNCINSLNTVHVDVAELTEFCEAKLKGREKKAKGGPSLRKLEHPFTSKTIAWRDAVEWMRTIQIVAGPDGARETTHIPLLDRSQGTSYEEKVAALQQSTKRRQRYEENVIKKRKTKEEDEAFYAHKIKQGGSALA